jgi:hypothetical protein
LQSLKLLLFIACATVTKESVAKCPGAGCIDPSPIKYSAPGLKVISNKCPGKNCPDPKPVEKHIKCPGVDCPDAKITASENSIIRSTKVDTPIKKKVTSSKKSLSKDKSESLGNSQN